MKLQGIDISSIVKPEAKFVILTKRFIPSMADEYPTFISYNEEKIKLREMILLNNKKIFTGYKYVISVKEDGGLTSLNDEDEIIISLHAKKLEKFLTTELRLIGLKKEKVDKILILYDVPVIGSTRNEIVEDVKKFLKLWSGIEIEDLPAKIIPKYKKEVKGKIVDVDYADLLFTV